MITIIHGDDTASSRNLYLEEKAKVQNPVVFDGSKILLTDLIQTIESGSLFNIEENLFIEKFFKAKKANPNFKEIVSYLNTKANTNIIFWEDEQLSKTDLSVFNLPKIVLFKIPQSLFIFLDSLKPSNLQSINNFQSLLSTMPGELIFFMIIRQFRLMLAVINPSSEPIDEVKRLAPWQIAKLKTQGSLFGKEKLIMIYQQLLQIDFSQKTGQAALNFVSAIDFFLAGL
jgi:hypothetical protein